MVVLSIPITISNAILIYSLNIVVSEDNEIVVLTKNDVQIFDTDKNKIEKEVFKVTWDVTAAEKGGYDSFMFNNLHCIYALRDRTVTHSI